MVNGRKSNVNSVGPSGKHVKYEKKRIRRIAVYELSWARRAMVRCQLSWPITSVRIRPIEES